MGLLNWRSATVVKERELTRAQSLEETSLVVADKNLAVTKKTPYEELVAKIEEENNGPVVLEKNLKRDIFREIMSVYFWLRTKLNMNYRRITAEEFETVKSEIKLIRYFEPDAYTTFFDKRYANFEDIHPFRMLINNIRRNTHSYYLYYSFDPESSTVAGYIADDRYSLVFPPNIIELMNEIYEKRCSDLVETTPRQ